MSRYVRPIPLNFSEVTDDADVPNHALGSNWNPGSFSTANPTTLRPSKTPAGNDLIAVPDRSMYVTVNPLRSLLRSSVTKRLSGLKGFPGVFHRAPDANAALVTTPDSPAPQPKLAKILGGGVLESRSGSRSSEIMYGTIQVDLSVVSHRLKPATGPVTTVIVAAVAVPVLPCACHHRSISALIADANAWRVARLASTRSTAPPVLAPLV